MDDIKKNSERITFLECNLLKSFSHIVYLSSAYNFNKLGWVMEGTSNVCVWGKIPLQKPASEIIQT